MTKIRINIEIESDDLSVISSILSNLSDNKVTTTSMTGSNPTQVKVPLWQQVADQSPIVDKVSSGFDSMESL